MQKLPFFFTAKEIISQGRTTQENLDNIKAWLSSLPPNNFLPGVQDEMIVIFLLSCDNDLDLTKNTITMYYKCKQEGPELYDNREMDREDIKKGMNTIQLSSIPVRTDENYAVHYFRLNDSHYRAFDLIPIMKISYMLLDITQERNLPSGLVVVIDMKGVSLMHLTRIKVSAIRKYFQFLQEGFPLQLKVIHFINAVYFFDKFMNIARAFMKNELVEMVKVHPPSTSQETLFSLVPKKCWPKEYGGDLPSYNDLHEITRKQFEEKQKFWRREQEIRHNLLE
ncbi:unnamed protein product [Ceutorhynchus assimilis]|uniref:CRAL-TRIO domain-containing protein n=1 Tax=Ceutorhynchus assimilis TaxID=467358 RepID=A0A9N9MU17_9CUCU|nr:unnamed protein product [Ceutorhynchus assimilis]